MNSFLHTYESAAERLRLKPQTLRNWVSAGKIEHYKIGGAVRFSDEQLDNILKNSRVEAAR